MIAPLQAHCDILILQHPNERRKAHSTARLVSKALINAKIMRGIVFDPEMLESELSGCEPFLLFPSPGSRDCRDVELSATSKVVVVDGTWSEAGKIVRRNPLLARLRHISFDQRLTSTYRIRRQPKEHCLSTIESIAYLLKLNAQARGTGAPDYDALLKGFDRMIELHLSRCSSPAT